jgi:hypothetical protein
MQRTSAANLLCVACAAIAFLLACGFEAPQPQRTSPPRAPLPPISTLTARLSVPASAIAEALNEKTKSGIVRLRNEPVDCAVAKCLLSVDVARNGPITALARNNTLSLSIPVVVDAQMPVKGAFFRATAHGSAQGFAQATTSFSLTPDWRLTSDTHGTIMVSQGRLKLGPVQMSIAELWNRNAEQLSEPLFRAIDRAIASNLRVRPEAERLWRRAVRPLRVAKSPQAWLVLAPEVVRVGEPAIDNDAVTIGLGVDVRAHVVVLDHSPEAAQIPPLPAFAPLKAPSNRFAFFVPVLLPYDEAATLALKRLAEKPLKIAGLPIEFEKLSILPSGRDVVIAVRFCVKQSWDPFGWFDSCGQGYLRGIPEFNASTHTIRVVNVRYDIGTESTLLSSSRALAGSELGHVLESSLVFDAGGDIAKLDDEIRAALAKPEGRGVQIHGNVETFGAPSLTWTDEGFLATFPAEGTVSVDLNIPQH